MATSFVKPTTPYKLINIDTTLHSWCTQPADVHVQFILNNKIIIPNATKISY